jgi:hypothetical protein
MIDHSRFWHFCLLAVTILVASIVNVNSRLGVEPTTAVANDNQELLAQWRREKADSEAKTAEANRRYDILAAGEALDQYFPLAAGLTERQQKQYPMLSDEQIRLFFEIENGSTLSEFEQKVVSKEPLDILRKRKREAKQLVQNHLLRNLSLTDEIMPEFQSAILRAGASFQEMVAASENITSAQRTEVARGSRDMTFDFDDHLRDRQGLELKGNVASWNLFSLVLLRRELILALQDRMSEVLMDPTSTVLTPEQIQKLNEVTDYVWVWVIRKNDIQSGSLKLGENVSAFIPQLIESLKADRKVETILKYLVEVDSYQRRGYNTKIIDLLDENFDRNRQLILQSGKDFARQSILPFSIVFVTAQLISNALVSDGTIVPAALFSLIWLGRNLLNVRFGSPAVMSGDSRAVSAVLEGFGSQYGLASLPLPRSLGVPQLSSAVLPHEACTELLLADLNGNPR